MRVVSLRAVGALAVNGFFCVAVALGQGMMADTEGVMVDSPVQGEILLDPNGQGNYWESDCGCPTCVATCGPVWYGAVEGLFLKRTRSDRIKIVEIGSEIDRLPEDQQYPRGQRPAIMTTDELDFDYEWGPRITIGRWLNECTAIEARYYGLQYWKSTASAQMDRIPFPDVYEADVPFASYPNGENGYTKDFDGAESITATYRSEFHNVEFNFLRSRSACFTMLSGFRYINLLEEFDLAATDDEVTSNYLIDAENHLVGWQLGGIYTRPITQRLSWDVTGMGGLYVNFARQRTYLGDEGNSVVWRDYTIDPGELAQIKHKANTLEQQFAKKLKLDLPRPVNLDPGIIEPSKLILATTKNYSHRIYIGNRMYAEVTLIYDKGSWKAFEYT